MRMRKGRLLQTKATLGPRNMGSFEKSRVRSLLLLSSKERGRMGLCRDRCGPNLVGRFIT
jgi:hypothetical protein